MKSLHKFLFLVLVLVLLVSTLPIIPAQAASAEPIMHVKLKNYLGNKTSISVVPEVSYSSNIGVKLNANEVYTVKASGGSIILLKGTAELGRGTSIEVVPGTGKGPISINGRPYLGSMNFTYENGYVRPINAIGMEDYLKGVVPAEMPALWNQEALKAQAVAARTYAMGYVNSTPEDTISKQVYGGYAWHPNATQAVDATKGQVIAYNGTSIGSNAFFTSSNGGKTETNSNVWGGTSIAYLTVQNDSYDPKTPWTLSVQKKQIDTAALDLANADAWWTSVKEAEQTTEIKNIKTWLASNGYGSDVRITGIPVLSLYGTGTGGRVTKGDLTLTYLTKSGGKAVENRIEKKGVNASAIRAIFGLDLMKSYLVTTQDSTGDKFTITGAGYGHGVGMSQYGAKKAGDQGVTYDKILSFYYKGTTLLTAYTPAGQTGSSDADPAPVITVPVPPAPAVPEPPKDQTAPVISAVTASYDQKETAVLGFAIDEAAKLTVKVKDEGGAVLAVLADGVQTDKGAQSFTWNIANAGNGTYTFAIEAVDGSANKAAAAVSFQLIKKDTAAPIVSDTSSSYDAKAGKVFFRYNLNEAAVVTVQVKDIRGKVISTYNKETAKEAGTHWASWYAAKAANGKYLFYIKAADTEGNESELTTPFTLSKPKDTEAPAIRSIKGVENSKTKLVSLSYTLSEAAKVTVQIKDEKGKAVTTLVNGAQQKAGVQSRTWSAAKAAAGKYSFTFTATDKSNNKGTALYEYSKTQTGKTSASLNVRSQAASNGKIIGSLKKNNTVTILSKTGSWYKIKFGKGSAYVHGDFVAQVK
ncbi:SpoIID/LytB domain-containing protein [Peribacillus sp. SCS-37]|uniref:SpoIID/LytB domain-containing protein n=1 Tax=Paraperibacillus esterisolvens TaxID=3115296 RepID=UPI003906049F